MKKDELMKLGLDEATAEKVAAASTEELKGFIPKERFDEVNRAKKHAEEALAERDGQIESLKASAGDADALKKQIETLQAENKQKDAAHAEEIKQIRITGAVDAALTAAKAKNLTAAKALLKLEGAELLDDGSVKGLAEQIEALRSGEGTSFLFEAKPKLKGAKTGASGDDDGGKADTSKMSYDELCAYLAENPGATLS